MPNYFAAYKPCPAAASTFPLRRNGKYSPSKQPRNTSSTSGTTSWLKVCASTPTRLVRSVPPRLPAAACIPIVLLLCAWPTRPGVPDINPGKTGAIRVLRANRAVPF